MNIHIQIADDGFVEGWSDCTDFSECAIGYKIDPNDVFFKNPFRYKLVDGVLVYDESKVLEYKKSRCKTRIDEEPIEDNKEILETMLMFQLGYISEIEYNGATYNKDAFELIVKEKVAEKESKKQTLKNKKEQIDACETIAELNELLQSFDAI